MTVTPFRCRLSPFLSSPSSLQPLSKTVFALKHPLPHSSTITRSLACVLNQKQETLMDAAAVEPATLDGSILLSASNDEESYDETQKRFPDKCNTEPLVIRRPVMDSARDEVPEPSGRVTVGGERIVQVVSSSSQDLSVDESDAYSVKGSVLEPERIFTNLDRPLRINLELALYRAKVLARSHQFADAEKLMRQCINIWPEDGRPYVALGRILIKQSRTGEARTVYEQGCQATQGENSYIWQCWAVLEKNSGNIRRSRELFDAATVADERHVAAWHGWAVLEIEQGNIKKARHLLGKGLKICGPSEYIYQTLALLEVKGSRIDQARYLFQQATLCNPKSCASWLAWAQMEEQQENHGVARKLLECREQFRLAQKIDLLGMYGACLR